MINNISNNTAQGIAEADNRQRVASQGDTQLKTDNVSTDKRSDDTASTIVSIGNKAEPSPTYSRQSLAAADNPVDNIGLGGTKLPPPSAEASARLATAAADNPVDNIGLGGTKLPPREPPPPEG